MSTSSNAEVVLSLRQLLAATHMEKETRRTFFPHLQHEREEKNPLTEPIEQIDRRWAGACLDIRENIGEIWATAWKNLPQPYGDIFCYIVYCDLLDRMKTYQELAGKLSRVAGQRV